MLDLELLVQFKINNLILQFKIELNNLILLFKLKLNDLILQFKIKKILIVKNQNKNHLYLNNKFLK